MTLTELWAFLLLALPKEIIDLSSLWSTNNPTDREDNTTINWWTLSVDFRRELLEISFSPKMDRKKVEHVIRVFLQTYAGDEDMIQHPKWWIKEQLCWLEKMKKAAGLVTD